MKYFSFLSKGGSEKSFINLIRIVIFLLVILILMNGGTVVVSLAKISYQAIESIFVSLLLSIVFVFILKPIALFLEQFNLTRTMSISIIYLVIFLSLGTIFGTIIPSIEKEISALQNEFPKYKDKVVQTIDKQEKYLKENYPILKEVNLSQEISVFIKRKWESSEHTDFLISSSKLIGSILTLLIMVPFITFFLLKDGSYMKKSLISLVPNRYFEMTLNLFHEINLQLGGFIRARLLEALCVGFICFVGLSVLDLKYAAVLALFASITNLIPYIGPFIGAIPALIVAFVDTGSWATISWVVVIYGIAQLFDIVVIIPAVFARLVNMHPLVVVIIIIIGGQLGGILGMIVAVPIYSITKVTIKVIHSGLSSLRA